MVFLIQRSQNKDSMAIHLKLNEIVAAMRRRQQPADRRRVALRKRTSTRCTGTTMELAKLALTAANVDRVAFGRGGPQRAIPAKHGTTPAPE